MHIQSMQSVIVGGSLMAVSWLGVVVSPAVGAEPLSESQLQRLMETAAQAPESPDHDYVTNSLHSMLRQAKDLKLSPQQTDKVKTITDQYERTRRDRENAYKQSEMEVLKLIHDSRSSLFSIESAVRRPTRNTANFAWWESRPSAKPETSWGRNSTVAGARVMRPNKWLGALRSGSNPIAK